LQYLLKIVAQSPAKWMKAITRPSIAKVRCNFSLGFGLNLFFKTVTTKIAAKNNRNAATPNQPKVGNTGTLNHPRSADSR